MAVDVSRPMSLGAVVRPLLATLATFLVVMVIWQLIVLAINLPAFIVPGPVSVLTYTFEHADILWAAAVVTIEEIVLGFVAALTIGFVIGCALVYSDLAAKTLLPLVLVMLQVPTVAVAPLFVLLFGFGLVPKLLVVFLMAFFPVAMSTVTGLRSVPYELRGLVQTMGGGWFVWLRKIGVPYARPTLFSGVKLAATISVTGAIVAEFVGSSSGLGNLILVSAFNQDGRALYAGVIVVVIVGVVAYLVSDAVAELAA
jgi:NitT/TauT family transport system permease protein